MSPAPHGPFSPEFAAASELIGRRWTGPIIWALFHGLRRFNHIAAAIPGISKNILSERLGELERHGIVTRTVISETPLHVEYDLTEKGLELRNILISIARWALKHGETSES